ncbi:hypothetical protein FKZ61_021490 [Litorilinea aerophila]|uniref:hypothetical protein n=1 Tax=Litorilinea aerophila TaxID=1204385 RepID=UPI0014777AE2|nr:hypothetical protein [Litorilinea aerophila]MCC9078674.1 hypothetical protein [Litorilinea aerophila]
MLSTVYQLITALNQEGIRYCHWKSNLALEEALMGQTDIDLLVHRRDAGHFRTLLSQHCFKPAVTTLGEAFPAVEHYFALDMETGVLVHVHAYYQAITGDSLTKNYHFPIEEMLLAHTRQVGPVRLPVKGAELVVFTLRMMLKHTSPMELFLLARYWPAVRQEARWLLEEGAREDALRFVACYLPAVDPQLFAACVDALTAPAPLATRVWLAHRLQRQLRPYGRHSVLQAWLTSGEKFARMAYRRLRRSRRGMVPQSGGAVVAFVGSEATGKSTLLGEMAGWLGEHFAVERIHAGKPRPTLLTALPGLLVPALRRLLPTQRSTRVEAHEEAARAEASTGATGFPLLYGLRAVLLAYERRALLTRAYSQAANGTVVLCDRYPSLQAGAPDSPQLTHRLPPGQAASLRGWLARLEARLYREIPPPDLVIYLSAPLEVTVARNARRGKREPEEYVRRRHARTANLDFGKVSVCPISTDQPLERTVLAVKSAIWEIM